jgi:hypothetical protein
MIIRCCQCDRPVTPELQGLAHFDAVALCATCAEENQDHEESDADSVEAGPGPLPAVDIDGRLVCPLDTSPEGLQEAKQAVDRLRLDLLQAHNEQVPVLRDACRAMAPAARQAFRGYVEAIIRLQQLEDAEAFASPFCLFRVVLNAHRLDPADGTSPYAGHYVSQRCEEVLFPKALLAALTAWDERRDLAITSLEELRPYE